MPYCPAVDAAFADSKHQRRGATDAINHEANWDPCRHEAIYLDEDEQKVVSKPDTRKFFQAFPLGLPS